MLSGIRISYLLLFFLFSGVSSLNAQNYMVMNQWRLMRHEVAVSSGVSNFLGELGGRDRIGANFIYDLETSLFESAYCFDYRYYLTRSVVLRNSFNYLKISGDDKLTLEKFRNNRNLHFKSDIFQFSTLLELQLMTIRDFRRHNLRNNRGRKIGWKYRSFGIYVFGGIGVFHFNPKGSYLGRWVDLYDLHTEGQGLPDGPEQYKRVAVSLPVGGGLRLALTKQMGLSLEFSHSFTFTDYIDDVSTVYYDNEALTTAYGSMAAYMADPSNGNLTAELGYSPTEPGYQRGDETDNDGFLYSTVGVYYKFQNRYRPPGGAMKKKQKVRAVF